MGHHANAPTPYHLPCCDSVWFKLLQIFCPQWAHICNGLGVSTKYCFLIVNNCLWALAICTLLPKWSWAFRRKGCDIDVYLSSEHSEHSAVPYSRPDVLSFKEVEKWGNIMHSFRAIASHPQYPTAQIFCGLNWNVPIASCFNTCSAADDTVKEGHRTFRRWSFAGGSASLGSGLVPLPVLLLHFLCADEVLSIHPSAYTILNEFFLTKHYIFTLLKPCLNFVISFPYFHTTIHFLYIIE